jgi:Phospholipase_D-nuclease N-terminal
VTEKTKKKWSDLTDTQQRLIVVGGAAEVVLTAVALRDLARRPSGQVRGPKVVWLLGFVVQPFGPLAYLWAGRRQR